MKRHLFTTTLNHFLSDLSNAVLLSAALLTGINAQANKPDTYFAADVVGQFNNLSKRPDALGFHKGDSPDPSRCRHYQGIVRYQGADDTPYFFVSRSGNIPPILAPYADNLLCLDISNQPGNLLVVKMGSRDKHGERMRSNRIARNTETQDSIPDLDDFTVNYITFDGSPANDGLAWPDYAHPGGMQIVGDVLIVPLEHPYQTGDAKGKILFIDVSDPENPKRLNNDFDVPNYVYTGLVSVAPLANGRYLMLVTGHENRRIWFFESLTTENNGSTDLKSSNLQWKYADTWTLAEDGDALGAEWPTGTGAHQTLHFIRESNIDGALYVAAARNTKSGEFFADDYLELYRFYGEENLYDDQPGAEFTLQHISTKHKVTYANSDGTLFTADLLGEPINANFAAASGYYVSPTGELLFYATEHANNGPLLETPNGTLIRGTIKAGEWRHIDIVRPGSPTLNPTVKSASNAPYTVSEGGRIMLSATSEQPLTKAWIELFSETHYTDRYVVIDYDDWPQDDFDNFKDLDGALDDLTFGFSDVASAWRYYAPQGCTLRANDDDFSDSSFPGSQTKTLAGTGNVEITPVLENVSNDSGSDDIDNALTSAQFFSDCDEYYAAPIRVDWDLDNDGVLDSQGQQASFSAIGLDGPGTVAVPVLATHSIDGRSGQSDIVVNIINAPPIVTLFGITDSIGQRIGVDIPFALVGSPLLLTGHFTDPGWPDTQTATIDWGDGTVAVHTEFNEFQDAFGGNTGIAKQSHSYSVAGTYAINFQVIDDDQGARSIDDDIDIVSAEQALEWVLAELDDLIADTTDSDTLSALQAARDNLEGNNQGSSGNGALDKLVDDDLAAALIKLEETVQQLSAAEASSGLDLDSEKGLLTLAAQSLAHIAYADALVAIPQPSNGQQKQLDNIAKDLVDGTNALAASSYVNAIEFFHSALSRAIKLIN